MIQKITVGIILLQLQRYNPTVMKTTGILSNAYHEAPFYNIGADIGRFMLVGIPTTFPKYFLKSKFFIAIKFLSLAYTRIFKGEELYKQFESYLNL